MKTVSAGSGSEVTGDSSTGSKAAGACTGAAALPMGVVSTWGGWSVAAGVPTAGATVRAPAAAPSDAGPMPRRPVVSVTVDVIWQDGPWEHRLVPSNGARFHVVLAGPESGELVLLLHGFPQFWWAWRHQITPLAEAGYHVVAPDMRGYNSSDVPHGLGAYHLDVLAEDVTALAVAVLSRPPFDAHVPRQVNLLHVDDGRPMPTMRLRTLRG